MVSGDVARLGRLLYYVLQGILALELLNVSNSHRTLLYAPFIPFIVVFCQVIETRDEIDLSRLQSFVASIDTGPPFPDAAANMYRLFKALYRVALRYIEFRDSTPPVDQPNAGAGLNTCLNALGFTHVGLNHAQQEATGLCPGRNEVARHATGADVMGGIEGHQGVNPIWMSNPAELEDWFNNNDQVMEFIGQTNFTSPQEDQGSSGAHGG